jgi:hypothetical protein
MQAPITAVMLSCRYVSRTFCSSRGARRSRMLPAQPASCNNQRPELLSFREHRGHNKAVVRGAPRHHCFVLSTATIVHIPSMHLLSVDTFTHK